MAAGLAHEIRNPLASIELLAGLVKRAAPDDDEVRDLVSELVAEVHAVAGTVHAALDFIHCASLKAGADCADGEAHTGTYPALKLPPLDPSRVFLLGYSLGSLVALHAAALAPSDRPVSGVAAFSGWTPWRTGGGGAATTASGAPSAISLLVSFVAFGAARFAATTSLPSL